MPSAARTQAACLAASAAPFDWNEWNRQFDEGLARYNAIEAEIAHAHTAMLRDVRGMIEGLTK